jgi:predicted permease
MRTLVEALVIRVRVAARTAFRAPRFSVAVIGCWALGIASASATYAAADGYFLRPPQHVHDPKRVVRLFGIIETEGREPATATRFSLKHVEAWQAANIGARVTAYEISEQSALIGDRATRLSIALVAPRYFDVFQVRPVAGHLRFEQQSFSDEAPIILDARAARRFFGDHSGLGELIRVRERHFRVIGVAPAGFNGGEAGAVDAWTPFEAAADLVRGRDWRQNDSWSLAVIARLDSRTDPRSLESSAAAILSRQLADENRQQVQPPRIVAASLVPGASQTSSPVGKAVTLVAIAGISLLLIASVNVGGLFVLRGLARQRELGVRRALGASAKNLVGDVVGEVVLLAALSSLLALTLVSTGGGLIARLLVPEASWGPTALDVRSLLITAAAGFGAAAVAGIIAATSVLFVQPLVAIGATHATDTARTHGWRTAIVGGQTALATLLVAGAVVVMSNLIALRSLDLGLRIGDVAVVSLGRSYAREHANESRALLERLRARASTVPSVQHASLAATAPFLSAAGVAVNSPDHPTVWQTRAGVPYLNVVDADFFKTVGMRLIRGRVFEPSDTLRGNHLVIVNETFARVAWGASNPIGRCIILGADAANPCYSVIGVVADVRRFTVMPEEPTMQVYITPAHNIFSNYFPPTVLLVKTLNTKGAFTALSRIVRDEAPARADISIASLEDVVDPQIRPWRTSSTLWALFGAAALVLMAVGIYSALAYAAQQRTREVAIRLALGARPSAVVLRVARSNMIACMMGVLVGGAVAVALARTAIDKFDLVRGGPGRLIVWAAGIMALIVAVSCVVPVFRYARRPYVRTLLSLTVVGLLQPIESVVSAQRIELVGQPLRITELSGRPLGAIEHVAADGNGTIAVFGGASRNQFAVLSADGRPIIAPVNLPDVGAQIAWPKAAAFDGPNTLTIIDAQSPRLARIGIVNGTVTLLTDAFTNLGSASSVCGVPGRRFILGRGTSRNKPALVTEFDNRGKLARSFGTAFGDGSNPSMFHGASVCLGSEGMVVVAANLVSEVRGYSLNGRPRWTTRVPGFRPMGIVREGRRIRYRLGADSLWDHTLSVFTPAPGVVAVQTGRMRGRTETTYEQIITTFLDATTGTVLGSQSNLPIIMAASRTKMFAIPKRSAEELRVFSFRYLPAAASNKPAGADQFKQ